MKKLFVTFSLILSLYSMNTVTRTYAIDCSWCATWAQQLVDYARQGLQYSTQLQQYAKDVIIGSNTGITAVQTTLTAVNETIVKPMKTAMTIMSIAQSAKMIKNLVTGSLGTQPLLIANPEKYINNAGAQIAKGGIGSIARNGGIFSDSILGSLVSSYQTEFSPLSGKLAQIGKSSLPSIIQNNICGDASLTNLATQNAASINANYTEADVASQRQQLYNYACSGDPTSDKQLASRLQNLSQQNPSLGGLDSILAISSGDNPYTQRELSKIAIDQAVAEREEAVAADIDRSGGLISPSECILRETVDENGDEYEDIEEAPCLERQITQTGSAIKSLYESALNSGNETLQSLIGTNSGLVGAVFDGIGLFNGISSAISGITGALGGGTCGGGVGGNVTFTTPRSAGGGGGLPVTVSSGINRPVTTASTNNTNQFANNPQLRNDLILVPRRQLTTHLESINTLKESDDKYLTKLAFYDGQLSLMKGCYANLVTNYQIAVTPQISSAYNYADSVTASNATKRAGIQNELGLVSTTRTLINNTISSMDQAISSESLLAIFTNYQNQIDIQGLPGLTSGGQREGDYVGFDGIVTLTLQQGGDLYNLNTQCATLGQQLEAERQQRQQYYDPGYNVSY